MKKIIRIRKVDIDGDKKTFAAIRNIKGVNFMMSNAILTCLGINPKTKLSDLTEAEIERLKAAIDNPATLTKIPHWMFNRRMDMETGKDLHLTGMDFGLAIREDIKRMQDTRSRRGIRHGMGLKVRGQRTQAHPRKGTTVGVMTKKKAAMMGKGGELKDAAATSSQDKKGAAAVKGAAPAAKGAPAPATKSPSKPEGGKK